MTHDTIENYDERAFGKYIYVSLKNASGEEDEIALYFLLFPFGFSWSKLNKLLTTSVIDSVDGAFDAFEDRRDLEDFEALEALDFLMTATAFLVACFFASLDGILESRSEK